MYRLVLIASSSAHLLNLCINERENIYKDFSAYVDAFLRGRRFLGWRFPLRASLLC